MINVPKLITPKITEIESQKARVRMRGNGHAKNIKELRAKGKDNIDDKASRITMVLAGEDIPASSEIDAKIATEMRGWEATIDAEQSLKAPLAAAKYEAATDILAALKKPHDEIMKRLLAALVAASAANAELFDLSRQLKDQSIGWRNGVCQLMPTDVIGVPHKYSELAEFMRQAVAAGYLSTLPKEFLRA
jgi:hypothetical protein